MSKDIVQISLFDSDEQPEKEKPSAEQAVTGCRFKNDKSIHWWTSPNTHLCDKSYDCSHCHIENTVKLRSNPIRKRGACSVFNCTKVRTKYIDGVFKNKCEITGNEWVSNPWSCYKDYNTYPIHTPCDFCDIPSCDICSFKKEVTEKNPYGCCVSCAHRLYCPNSKHNNADSLTVNEFFAIAAAKSTLDGKVVDLSKGITKENYQSSCPYYNGYLCNGSQSQTLCKATERPIKSEIFRSICENNSDLCPINKKLKNNKS